MYDNEIKISFVIILCIISIGIIYYLLFNSLDNVVDNRIKITSEINETKLRYYQDKRTDKCFAYYKNYTHGGNTVLSISNVPCDEKVKKEINNEK